MGGRIGGRLAHRSGRRQRRQRRRHEGGLSVAGGCWWWGWLAGLAMAGRVEERGLSVVAKWCRWLYDRAEGCVLEQSNGRQAPSVAHSHEHPAAKVLRCLLPAPSALAAPAGFRTENQPQEPPKPAPSPDWEVGGRDAQVFEVRPAVAVRPGRHLLHAEPLLDRLVLQDDLQQKGGGVACVCAWVHAHVLWVDKVSIPTNPRSHLPCLVGWSLCPRPSTISPCLLQTPIQP